MLSPILTMMIIKVEENNLAKEDVDDNYSDQEVRRKNIDLDIVDAASLKGAKEIPIKDESGDQSLRMFVLICKILFSFKTAKVPCADSIRHLFPYEIRKRSKLITSCRTLISPFLSPSSSTTKLKSPSHPQSILSFLSARLSLPAFYSPSLSPPPQT